MVTLIEPYNIVVLHSQVLMCQVSIGTVQYTRGLDFKLVISDYALLQTYCKECK